MLYNIDKQLSNACYYNWLSIGLWMRLIHQKILHKILNIFFMCLELLLLLGSQLMLWVYYVLLLDKKLSVDVVSSPLFD